MGIRLAPETAKIFTTARSASLTVNVTGSVADSPGASAYNRPSAVANFTPGLGLSQRISAVADGAPPLFQKRTFRFTGWPAVAQFASAMV